VSSHRRKKGGKILSRRGSLKKKTFEPCTYFSLKGKKNQKQGQLKE
jgi:hypothetical protein